MDDYETEIFSMLSVHTRDVASFWWENAIAITVILLRVLAKISFVVTETSYQMLEVLLEVAFYYGVPSNPICNFIFVYRCLLKGELRGNSLHKVLQNCLKIVANRCEPPLDN